GEGQVPTEAGRGRGSSKRPDSFARSAAPATRRHRRLPPYQLQCRGNRVVSARPKLLSQSKSLFGRAAHPRGEPQTHAMRGGGWAGRLRFWGRTKDGNPAAFIGTLIKGVQARPGRKAQK